ncbi:MAG: DNA polymerase IV [Candidatus Dormibacteria bacterium]
MGGTPPLTASPPRAIIHLDLDAFYASVEQLRHPELRGRPVIVGGGADQGTRRSVVSAASYEARPFGVRSAMPLSTALRLCPTAVVVPVDFSAYRAASTAIMSIARRFTPLVQPVSLDEAFLDVTGSQTRFGPAPAIAVAIRDLILEECSLHASFGVATCKVVAKVASDLHKPRGLVVVRAGEEAAFLAPLALRRLPGLGPAAERRLAGLGVTTVGGLAALPLEVVAGRVGRAAGTSLWERAAGLDASPVSLPGRPKSVSREETFAIDAIDPDRILRRLRQLSADVGLRLRAEGLAGRTIGLRVRYRDFTTINRQLSLPDAVNGDRAIGAAAQELYRRTVSSEPVRLLGVAVAGLQDAPGTEQGKGSQREATLDRALDALRERFGDTAVRRGTSDDRLRDLDFRGNDLRQPSSSR